MSYVLQRLRDGAFVARPGNRQSYVKSLGDARAFDTVEQAKRDQCGNERLCRVVYDGGVRIDVVQL